MEEIHDESYEQFVPDVLDIDMSGDGNVIWTHTFEGALTNKFEGGADVYHEDNGIGGHLYDCDFTIEGGGAHGTPEGNPQNCNLASNPECCGVWQDYGWNYYEQWMTEEIITYSNTSERYYGYLEEYYGDSYTLCTTIVDGHLSNEYTTPLLIAKAIEDVTPLPFPEDWWPWDMAVTALGWDPYWGPAELDVIAQKMQYHWHFPGKQDVRYLITWKEITVYDDGGVSEADFSEHVMGTGGDTVGTNHVTMPPRAAGATFVADAQVTEAGDDSPCASCPGGEGLPGDMIPEVGGVNVRFSLGRALLGQTAGNLMIAEGVPSPLLTSPLILRYSEGRNDVELIAPGGILRQVKAPQTLADIVQTNEFRYDLKFYLPSQVGSKVGDVYQLSGDPFVAYAVENPNGSTNYDQLRITKTTPSATNVWQYSWDAANHRWQLTPPGGLQSKDVTLAWDDEAKIQTETRVVRNPAGQAIGQTIQKIQHFQGTYRETAKLVEQTVGTGATAQTTQWLYDTSRLENSGRVNPQWMVQSSGYWEYYEYDPDHLTNRVKKVSSFLDVATNAVPDNLNQCRVTEYEYDPSVVTPDSGDDASIDAHLPRRVIETLLGQEVSRRYLVVLPNERRDIRCQTVGAAWNAANNLATITRTYGPGHAFEGKLKTIDNPDGTRQVWFYATNSTQLTNIVLSGQADPANLTNVLSGTKTITVSGLVGQMVSRTVTDIASGLTLASETYSNYDEYNRPRRVTYLDGSYADTQFACCGLDNTTDRDGTVTQFWYDSLGRQTATTRLNITTTNILDATGNVLVTKRIGSDLTTITTGQTAYDLAGRVTSETNALGGVTTYAESTDGNGHLVRTATAPDGGTRIETFFKDGQLKEVSGTAANPVRYEYGVEQDGGLWRAYTKEIRLGSAGETTEWTKSYTDFLGRTYKTVYPDAATTQSFYNNPGQLWKQVDPDGNITLYTYNARGEQDYTLVALSATARTLTDYASLLSQLTTLKAGTDRITQTASSVLYNATLGANVRRSITAVWTNDNQNVSVNVATNDVATDGLRSWSIAWNGSNAITNHSGRGLPDASKYVYATNKAPDGSFTVTKSQYGRVLEVTRKNSGGSQIGKTTYAYDPHGRQYQVTDARNGTTTTTYNAADLPFTVTTPAPRHGPARPDHHHLLQLDAPGHEPRPTRRHQPDQRVFRDRPVEEDVRLPDLSRGIQVRLPGAHDQHDHLDEPGGGSRRQGHHHLVLQSDPRLAGQEGLCRRDRQHRRLRIQAQRPALETPLGPGRGHHLHLQLRRRTPDRRLLGHHARRHVCLRPPGPPEDPGPERDHDHVPLRPRLAPGRELQRRHVEQPAAHQRL
jgi:YD repeat-containing protein